MTISNLSILYHMVSCDFHSFIFVRLLSFPSFFCHPRGGGDPSINFSPGFPLQQGMTRKTGDDMHKRNLI